MPKRIIIVRHGQTVENKQKILQGHLDTLLDDDGKKQAQAAAELLKNEKNRPVLFFRFKALIPYGTGGGIATANQNVIFRRERFDDLLVS